MTTNSGKGKVLAAFNELKPKQIGTIRTTVYRLKSTEGD